MLGFDPAIAETAGMEIDYSDDGMPYLVDFPSLDPIDSEDIEEVDTVASEANLQPSGVIPSNCGSSYVYLYNEGHRRYRVETGFHTYTPSLGYTWSANVIHPSSPYNHTHRWHGVLLPTHSFHMVARADVRTYGWATSKATGWTVLANGILCRSLGPSSTAFISSL